MRFTQLLKQVICWGVLLSALVVVQPASADISPSNPLVVTFTSPYANPSTVSGPSAVLSVSVSDSQTNAVAVQFSLDGKVLGVAVRPPYQATWDTTLFSNGTHTLSAIATDSAGNQTSASLTVEILNRAADYPVPTLQLESLSVRAGTLSGDVLLIGADPQVVCPCSTRVRLRLAGRTARTTVHYYPGLAAGRFRIRLPRTVPCHLHNGTLTFSGTNRFGGRFDLIRRIRIRSRHRPF